MESLQGINLESIKVKQESLKQEFVGNLLKLIDLMPSYYIMKIKSKIGQDKFSTAYISQFFRGKHELNHENSCILDAAIELVNERNSKLETDVIRTLVKTK